MFDENKCNSVLVSNGRHSNIAFDDHGFDKLVRDGKRNITAIIARDKYLEMRGMRKVQSDYEKSETTT